ncbi:MAG: hypothetical protein PHO89_05985 [Methylacidiphilaceae bacterium]|nr:hypothetical protein [Candidatus Methylacidiphilaceae bacterium]
MSAPVTDGEAFAAACRRLYTDRLLWEQARAGALAAVSRDCDPKRFSEAIHELLDELVGQEKDGSGSACRSGGMGGGNLSPASRVL